MKIFLNLLPEEKKKEMYQKQLMSIIVRRSFYFVLFIIMLIGALSGLQYYWSMQLNDYTSDLSDGRFQELREYKEQSKSIGDKITKIQSMQKKQINWYNIFKDFGSKVSEDIVINKISNTDSLLEIEGQAKERETILNFKDKLASSSCFENISVPLSDLVVKEDVDFSMRIIVTEDCLKSTSQQMENDN